MEGIRILTLEKLGENERGTTYLFDIDRKGQFMLGYRKAGTVNGNHYHKGISQQKRPEILILIDGHVIIRAKNMETGEEFEQEAAGPCRLEIDPMIWHEVEAVSDISFAEFNALKEHEKDTFYLEE